MYAVIGTNSWGGAIYEKLLRGSSVDKETLKAAIDTALKNKMFIFDTAANYGFGKSQKIIGELCSKEIELSAKSTSPKKYKRGQVRAELEKTLLDTRRSYAEVYWLHLPLYIEENLTEMAELYREGKIHNIGISNVNIDEAKRANTVLHNANIPLFGVQNHYSLLAREWEQNGLFSWCRENNVEFWAWAVLEEGLLVPPKKQDNSSALKTLYNGKRKKLAPLYDKLEHIGKIYNITAQQTAIAFCSSKGIVPVCGCRKPYQVEQLFEAAKVYLSETEIKELEIAADNTGVKIMGADMFRFMVMKLSEDVY
ncbi:MAG: aldo/keto reductase [Firmicutes bacterium]|nr:aldo/keto reductase [Bacillota bacterium]